MSILRVAVFAGIIISGLVFSVASLGLHSWGNYHWERASNLLYLGLGDNVNYDRWYSYLDVANDDWDASSVLNLAIVTGEAGNTKRCKATTGKVEICNDSYGNTGWLGIAGISVNGDHIRSGYVKLNDFYFDNAYNTPAWQQMVMCQEIGHIFGLGHQDENFNNANLNTCMDYTSNPASNQHPNNHDYVLLEDIYAHLDGGVEDLEDPPSDCFPPNSKRCRGAASAADILAEIEMNGPAQWGRLVSAHGPMEVYELDFGGGRKVITHVTWTLEAADKHEH
jgi:hypothetical protein